LSPFLFALYKLEPHIIQEAFKSLFAKKYINAFNLFLEAGKKSIDKIRIEHAKIRAKKKKRIPMLYLYSQIHSGEYKYDNIKIIGGSAQILYLSHIDPRIIKKSDRGICVAHFENNSNSWYLVNDKIDYLALLSKNIETKIAIGNKIKLIDDQQLILFKRDNNNKIAIVKFI
jgi:hypothetical protein